MKKTIKIILIIVLVLLISMAAIPFLFKDKIFAKVKSEINKNINAKVEFSGFDLSLFRNFPRLTLELENLSVAGIEEFQGDTLANIKSAAFTVDIMSVISGSQIDIRTIDLDEPQLNLLVLENGKANWDIAKPDADTAGAGEPSEFDVSLKKYEIKKGNILYDDRVSGTRVYLQDVDHTGSGDFTQDLFTLKTNTEAKALTLNYGGISYLSNVKTSLKADLEMDMVNSEYTFNENLLVLNALKLAFDGFIAMPGEEINMDLKFSAKENEFKNFISLIPGIYREGFDKVQSSGTMGFDGFAKGVYAENKIPAFGLNVEVKNGNFKYPDLPTGINNVQLDLKMNNPDGVPDHTVINLSRLHAEMSNQPFDAKLIVKTPVSDADIDATVKGNIDLANVSKFVPLEKGTSLSGNLNADVSMKGRMSSIENKRYEQFASNGTLSLNRFNYISNDYKEGIQISTAELVFNPKNITLNSLLLKTGNTDISASGWIDNLVAYMFKENELLKGTMNVRSGTIDINQFMTSEEGSAKDTAAMEVFEVPENIDFILTVSADKILYDDLVLENTKGNIAIRDRTLGMNGISFGLLGGTVMMDGLYETKNLRLPSFFMDLNLSGLDVKQTFQKFIAVQKLAPIAEKCSGNFSSNMEVKGNLDSKMAPVLTSLTGGGKLTSNNITVDNFKPLVKVSEALKMDQFKKMDLKNLNLSFSFADGRVVVQPFEQNIAGINSVISGSNGFDQSIDYNIKLAVPTAMLGSSTNKVVSGLLAQANSATGANLSMGDKVNINVNIGGTVTNPVIKTGMGDLAKSTVSGLKDQAVQQLEEKKKELEDKAKAEADRLKKEAQAEADRIKKEAEAKAKAESDRLKKEAEEKLKKEAEGKLKDLFGKPK